MAELKLVNLKKKFDDFIAVDNLTLTVNNSEFITLLGPSGCGKTTTLRMIAGFEKPTNGYIVIDDKVITSVKKGVYLPPDKRDMGMVFQSYAVWPHMNVYKNVAYPLKFKKLQKKDIKERVSRILTMVKLDGFEKRFPHQLSGGQQQRVALARSLVMEPSVLLLDEPLSNLDAKLREGMRYEIVELQKRLRFTVVYVTHDQIEAMAMSDRVVVINHGVVQQIDTPRNIYKNPSNTFVANFIGLANFIPCKIINKNKKSFRVRLEDGFDKHFLTVNKSENKTYNKKVVLVIRPEDIDVLPLDIEGGMKGILLRQTYLGDRNDCLVKFGKLELRVDTLEKYYFKVGQEVKLVFNNSILLPVD